MRNKIELSIIIPCYNEAENLEVFLPDLTQFCIKNYFQLIIVNDGSKDSSKEVLTSFSSNELIKIINHKVNKGYGAAIKSGINYVNTNYLVTIDGDGQHELDDILKLYNLLKEKDADMVVGSRKDIKPYSLYRHFGKFLIRSLAKLLIPLNIYDINSGMKIYNTQLAKQYLRLCPDSMAFSDIITLVFINQKHLVLETPIKIKERFKGQSTISTCTAFETVLELFNIIMLFNPSKIFIPLALILFILGVLWGLPIILIGRGVSVGAMLAILSALAFFLLGLVAEQLSSLRKQINSNK